MAFILTVHSTIKSYNNYILIAVQFIAHYYNELFKIIIKARFLNYTWKNRNSN